MERSRGLALTELAAVVAVACLALAAAAARVLPAAPAPTGADAVHDAHALLQLARLEAVRRNRPCRLVVDPHTPLLTVVDGRGTAQLDDDLVLHERPLPGVRFASPDGNDPVLLEQAGEERFAATFRPDGTLAGDPGHLILAGRGAPGRVAVSARGMFAVRIWDGHAWIGVP